MSLREAAIELRSAQRAYMADRGNEEKGRAVAAAAERMDKLLAKPPLFPVARRNGLPVPY